jgi:hypothetical protein
MIAIIESIESPNMIIEIKHDNTMKEMLSFKKTFIYFLILAIISTNINRSWIIIHKFGRRNSVPHVYSQTFAD